ncbi:T9SS type A sorting domain-containing protein [Flavobacterium sp. '19STA2R22 D10 B1']|uniref:T9SS type A sorting domain-containing protein n=1 Tax=Flavobacterium aerium TaxID=3037261 RepID=UPI00278C680A|nr:T9SS type A sorting domain-containing protein [Flavobacterium sp. '19STA2R22 D10 B1']
MKKIYALLLVLTMYSAFGQDGSLDTSWSTTVGSWDFVQDPNGNIYVANSTVSKVLPNGAAAPGFISPSYIEYTNRIFYHDEGSVFVGGPFVNYNGTGKNYVLKFNAATGALVAGFTAALPINTQVVSISQLPNGRLLVGAMAFGIAGPTISKSFFCLNQTTGAIDPTFNNGSNGISTIASVWNMTRDQNNTTIIAGNFSHYNGAQRDGIAKINQDGSLQPFTFLGKNSNGLFQSVGVHMSSGDIVVGGDFTHTPTGRKNLLRIKSDGSLDTSFNPQLNGIYTAIQKVLVLSSGKVLIMGSFQSIGGVPRPGIARLNIDGSLDTCFDPGTGPKYGLESSSIEFAQLDSKENLLITGAFDTFNGITVNPNSILKLRANTVLVANPDTATVTKGTTTVTAVPNVLVNDFYNGIQASIFNVTISQDGLYPAGISLDPFTGAVKVESSVLAGTYVINYKICPKNSNCNCATATVTIVVKAPIVPIIANDDSGSAYAGSATNVLNVLANDSFNNGSANGLNVSIISQTILPPWLKFTTTIGGSSVYGDISVLATAPVGTYTFTYQICNKNNSANCDSATVTITILSSELVNGIRANELVRLSGLQSTSDIIIAGYFTTYNNISTMRIARLNPNLTLDTSFNAIGPVPNNTTVYDFKIQPDNKIVVVGQFTGFSGGTTGKGITRLTKDGDLDPQFNNSGAGAGGEGVIYTTCLQNDGKILIAGKFTTYNGVTKNNIARLNSTGGIDMSFGSSTGFIGTPNSMVIQPDGKIVVVGTFGYYQGVLANGIIRLNIDGSIDSNFLGQTGTGLTGSSGTYGYDAMKVFLQPDGKIIVIGDFTAYNNVSRRGIIRLLSNGAMDNTFVPGVYNGLIRTVALTPNGQMYIGGDFTTLNGTSVNSIVRLNTNGVYDSTFDTGTGPAGRVWTLTRQPFDGKVIVGGQFTTYNGIAAGNITRIAPGIPGSQSREINPEMDINFIQKNSIAIYPNPSEGVFNIDFKGYEYEKFDMTIHNALGQLIYQGVVTPQNTNQIDLSKFEGGSYFVKLQNNNETINKIIVKK